MRIRSIRIRRSCWLLCRACRAGFFLPWIHSISRWVFIVVPFCASTCDFCAFYQEKPRRADLDRYLAAMEVEFQQLPQDRVVDTVFWGGGTPGLLAAKDLDRLGSALRRRLKQAPQEWTVEMAPSTVKADKLAVLRDLGVTRISMGVQSFDADLLESLGRLHRPNQIYKAWGVGAIGWICADEFGSDVCDPQSDDAAVGTCDW